MWLNRSQWSVIFAVTIGGILEWYEIFLYAYWSPVIAKLLFPNIESQIAAQTNAFLIFALGLASRPLGGIIFGLIGDKKGRRRAFVLSIFAIAFPSFLIGLFPFYATGGIVSLLILGLLRFIQGIPAGGELPGAMCYLAEYAKPKNMRLMCSFAFIGPQIGGILGLLESAAFEKIFSGDLIKWGLSISFLLGGILALFGVKLRKSLKETPAFEELEQKQMVLRRPLLESFKKYSGKMTLAFFLSLFEVAGYFILAIFPVVYFDKIFNLSSTTNLLITAFLLILSAITIPFFGRLADYYNNKKLFLISALGTLALSYPFYLSINHHSLPYTLLLETLLMLFLNIQFALLPSLLVQLVPVSVRFTCIGFSFNFCDGLIGGLITYLCLCLIKLTGTPGSFILILALAAIISTISLLFVKETKAIV